MKIDESNVTEEVKFAELDVAGSKESAELNVARS
jgi:hypothetical protein